MNVCVIGGTGHIGSQLIPLLVREGFEVQVITRGTTRIPSSEPWEKVEIIHAEYLHRDKNWYEMIGQLKTDVIIDLLGIDLPGIYQASRHYLEHLIVCGSLWMYGPPVTVPTPEEFQNPCEFEEYARRYHEIIGIQNQAGHDGIPFTAIMPSNICGPGKIPLEPAGGRSLEVHKRLSNGGEVELPEMCNTLVAPVDVSDVATGFFLAVMNRDVADHEIFNVGPPYAITIDHFVRTYESIYRKDFLIEYVSWEDFFQRCPEPGANYHFREHMAPDISKISRLLGYEPNYPPEESMERAVSWIRDTYGF